MSSSEEIREALRRFPRRRIRRWGSWRGGSLRAVMAIAVVHDSRGPAVVLTRCACELHEHPHLLPGLRTRPRESAPDAARRAVADELGMRLPPRSVLGLLDDYQARSGFVITPVVVWVGEHSESLPPREARAFAVPMADLDVEPVFVAGPESDRPVIRLPLHGTWLHAPTAAVLYQFREVVLHHRRTRVTHLTEPILAHR